jgi:hypothetical protein
MRLQLNHFIARTKKFKVENKKYFFKLNYMRNSRKYLILIIFLIILAVAGMVFFRLKNRIIPTPLPPAQTYNPTTTSQTSQASQTTQTLQASQAQNSTTTVPNTLLPAEVNLKIPFTSQAPNQNWSLPYQQFCEEASVLMVSSYIKNQPIIGPSDADTKLLAIMNFEIKKFGYYEDTTAEETATILKEFYGIDKVQVVPDPTIPNIKRALSMGKAVLVPLAGQQIGNPNYKQPGPLYHMLVIKGYTKSGDFITNDPGTRKGADYIYNPNVIMNAIHDWNGDNVNAGKKVILIVG